MLGIRAQVLQKRAREEFPLRHLNVPISRRLVAGMLLAGGLVTTLASPGCSQTPPVRSRVRVRDFGARGDGRSDDTAAFQAAHDSLAGGGVIEVDPGTYRVSRVDISNRNVQIALADGATLRKLGDAGVEARGIFVIENLQDANFELRGGRVDLNGEGPMGIGQPGRLRNVYAALTVPSVKAISGPANAAIYALRSTHIGVTGTTIENSGESGILLRNCSDTLVEGCSFRNLAGYGVEWSMVSINQDNGRGPMPDRARNHVRNCHFEDLDDYGLGSGNGVGAGGGGSGAGWVRDYSITDCTFLRCQADINFEFYPGSGVIGLELARLRSQNARQEGFGLVGVRDSVISDLQILNPGAAPTAALGPNWPSIQGGSLSSDFAGVRLIRVQVTDDRDGIIHAGNDGEIARGTRIFRAGSAGFVEANVGAFIGVRGANPEGVCYVGRIVRVVSPVEAELDLPAGATVRGASYAYGGACREGLRLFHGTSASIEDCRIEAGIESGLPGEPPAAGIRIENMRDPVSIERSVVAAPRGSRRVPVGIDLIRSRLSGSPQVTGFARSMIARE